MFIIDDLIFFVGFTALGAAGGAKVLAGGLEGAERRIEQYGHQVAAETKAVCEEEALTELERQKNELHQKYAVAMDELERRTREETKRDLLRAIEKLSKR